MVSGELCANNRVNVWATRMSVGPSVDQQDVCQKPNIMFGNNKNESQPIASSKKLPRSEQTGGKACGYLQIETPLNHGKEEEKTTSAKICKKRAKENVPWALAAQGPFLDCLSC